MSSTCTYPLPLLIFLILSLSVFISKARTQIQKTRFNNSISAIFVFGDSTVDPGNNNYIETPFRSDFPPYGRDFVNHSPTGRFTNGRLATDFIASYVGIKDYVPPYLDPTISIQELVTGVSFASAGSGFDPLTARISSVISMQKQVEYFREYKRRIEVAIEKERSKNLIDDAIFIVSAGTNDFVVNYFGPPIRRNSYTLSSYHQFLMQRIQHFIQELLELGARKIVMVGMPPIGCLPIVITLNVDTFQQRECIESLSSVAIEHNHILEHNLKAMQKTISTDRTAKIFYADLHKPFSEIIKDHKKFGFEEVNIGCCGTGLLEAAILCNPVSSACSDASKYVFWDSVHPTERAYYITFKALGSTIDLVING